MNGIAFVFFFLLFLAGLYLMGMAFEVAEEWALVTFAGGILATGVAFGVPAHVLGRSDH